MGKQELTNEQVVEIYMDAYLHGSSLTEAARAFGVSKSYLAWRAKRLRHAGVSLPKKYTAHEADVAKLNELIKTIKLAP